MYLLILLQSIYTTILFFTFWATLLILCHRHPLYYVDFQLTLSNQFVPIEALYLSTPSNSSCFLTVFIFDRFVDFSSGTSYLRLSIKGPMLVIGNPCQRILFGGTRTSAP